MHLFPLDDYKIRTCVVNFYKIIYMNQFFNFNENKGLTLLKKIDLNIKIKIYTHFLYKHMNFLAEAFPKHILCFFFRQKPSCAMCLIFLKKSLHVLIQQW